jgi:TonB family protein
MGGATVTYRPDGRPAQAAIEAAALPELCRAVIEALVRVTIAEERVPLVPTTQDVVVLPMHQAVVACMDQPSDPLRGDAPRIGQSAASAPVKTVDVKPIYPASARASGTAGLVILEGTISNRGCIRDIAVIRSPSAPLSIAALQAVSQWGYAPALIAGEPVEVRMTVAVSFNLE